MMASTATGGRAPSSGVGRGRGEPGASETTAQVPIVASRTAVNGPRDRTTAAACSGLGSNDEATAKTPARASPLIVDRLNAGFDCPTRIVGVAKAWRAKNPAAQRKARLTRVSRASARD